ncbi:MAG: hypothetical protein ACRDJC_01530 [Thermomicrobiales bacterium]
MKTLMRGAVALLAGLSLSVAVAMPALAEPKHVLIVNKVNLMAAVGKATLDAQVADILANVEEDFGWSVGP